MSSVLLSEKKPCFMWDKTTVSDGDGGVITTYVKGAEFEASIFQENTSLEKIASALTQQTTYKVFTSKSVTLKSGDIIECEGKRYQIKFDNSETQTPKMSPTDVRYTTAELWGGVID